MKKRTSCRKNVFRRAKFRVCFFGRRKNYRGDFFDVVSNTPQELESDVKRYGIILTGGGSLVYGVKTLIEKHAQIKGYNVGRTSRKLHYRTFKSNRAKGKP
ncbi:MAG: rod shape-determining protein [Clostridiales bacterium]|nr:MAG: rod shape-determining protein [Clostridiales bacterium]